MDVGELLSFKPVSTPKRSQPGELDDEEERVETERHRKKRFRVSEAERRERERKEREERGRQREERQREVIARLVDGSEANERDGLDEAALKRLLLLLEKRALKNREMRIKFPEGPDKFMESEVELHEAVEEMRAVAAAPELYPAVVRLGAVPTLLELLSHENTDMAVGVLDLLQELTDADPSLDGTQLLVRTLLDNRLTSLLLHNLQRLDENVQEEANGVHDTLAVLENVVEVDPGVVAAVGKEGFLNWLLRRLKNKAGTESNRLYASEMLSVLLQDCNENRELVGSLGGVDILLQQLSHYKRHDPSSPEDTELMENLFDSLCSCLALSSNKALFLRGEGLQLMNLMLREKKLSRSGSLRVLNHALTGPDGADNSNKFVDVLGLRSVFPLFMKTPKRRGGPSAEEHEEHVLAVVAALLRNCRGNQRTRLLTKFTENDMEKVDRLLELHFKYTEKTEAAELRLHSRGIEDEEEFYLNRLDGGLFTLQLVDYILLEITASTPQAKARVTRILAQRGASLKTIRHVMREYAGNLGDHGDPAWKQHQQQYIIQLIDKF